MTGKSSLNREIPHADISRVVQELGLSDPDLIREVEQRLVALIHRLWDLERLKLVGRSRREQIEYIEKVHKHLAALERTFESADPAVNKILGVALGEPLSRMLGIQGIQEIYPGIAPLSDPRRDELPKRRRESYEASDRADLTQRIDEHCIEVLLRIARAIDQPLVALLELEGDRKNKGGRPRNIYRDRIIKESAEIFRIASLQITKTVGGPFENFCADVLEIFGLPTEGLHDAINDCL